MLSRLQQIWLGQATDPDKATAYRKRFVRQHAEALGISRQEAYRLLCEQYGEPPESLSAAWLATKQPAVQCKDGKPTLPPLTQRAANFGKAVLRHIQDRGRKLSETDSQRRLEICQGCPLFIKDKFACADKRCGCNLRVKATWASETCPRGKWPEIEKSG